MQRSDDPEIPLGGGNSGSDVRRRGDVVLRRARAQTATVHRFLAHLRASGIKGVPKPLGMEPDGRERLSFLPGKVSHAAADWADVGRLREAVGLLRQIHDTSCDFTRADDDVWGFTHPDGGEVIGHNDFGPYNMVLRDGRMAGVFDFDLAGPAPPLRDLGYFAYWTVPLSFAAEDLAPLAQADIAAGHPRLRAIAAAYGTEDFSGLFRWTADMLHHLGDEAEAVRLFGDYVARDLRSGGHFDHWQREAAAFDANWREAFVALLA